jgi:aspartate 1-decarboxylase
MEVADLLAGYQVAIVDVTNGARLSHRVRDGTSSGVGGRYRALAMFTV